MSKSDYVRFAVGSPGGAQSSVWNLWNNKNKSDLYIAPRLIARQQKISLHKTGEWHLAFTNDQHLSDRFVSKFQKPAEVIPGLTKAYVVIVPSTEVVTPISFPQHPPAEWYPLPSNDAVTHFTIWLTAPDRYLEGGGTGVRDCLMNTLADGRHVYVTVHDEPLTDAQRTVLEKSRKRLRDVNPNPDSYVRGYLFAQGVDGTRSFIDVFVSDSIAA